MIAYIVKDEIGATIWEGFAKDGADALKQAMDALDVYEVTEFTARPAPAVTLIDVFQVDFLVAPDARAAAAAALARLDDDLYDDGGDIIRVDTMAALMFRSLMPAGSVVAMA